MYAIYWKTETTSGNGSPLSAYMANEWIKYLNSKDYKFHKRMSPFERNYKIKHWLVKV
jgi:hypothetical protein